MDTDLRQMFLVKLLRNPIITLIEMGQVQYCGVNDDFWIQSATPSFFSRQRPNQPATLPTLRGTGQRRWEAVAEAARRHKVLSWGDTRIASVFQQLTRPASTAAYRLGPIQGCIAWLRGQAA